MLAKAYLIMFEKKARLELQMQFTKAKLNMLNGGDSGKLIFPHDISGEFTIVQYFNQQLMPETSMNEHPVSQLRQIINKDIEVCIIAPPNNSFASCIDEGNITVTED